MRRCVDNTLARNLPTTVGSVRGRQARRALVTSTTSIDENDALSMRGQLAQFRLRDPSHASLWSLHSWRF